MKIMSIDAETNGLYGKAFAIAAITYVDGVETARFTGRCLIKGAVDGWVAANVLPQMGGIPVTHGGYLDMLIGFVDFFQANKAGAHVIVHMGCPVEARLFIDAQNLGIMATFEGPYPLVDVAGMLLMAGEDPTLVDAYNRKHGLAVRDFEGSTHNPLYDAESAAVCFAHLMSKAA
jgi:hypothetical protein